MKKSDINFSQNFNSKIDGAIARRMVRTLCWPHTPKLVGAIEVSRDFSDAGEIAITYAVTIETEKFGVAIFEIVVQDGLCQSAKVKIGKVE